MVEYKCEKCTNIFTRKQVYENHIKRKFSCTINLPKLTEVNQKSPILVNNEYKCNYCGKEFCNKYTLERHITDRCKIKQEENQGYNLQLLIYIETVLCYIIALLYFNNTGV